jgi:tetratricopeptide (TPR) repeat protein
MSALAPKTQPDTQFESLLAAAEARREAGRPAEAEGLLRVALRAWPRSAAAHNALGMVLFDLGRMALALGSFERACALAPLAAGGWGNCGMVLKTLDRFDEAIAAYDRALALAPAAAQLRLNRAIALLRAGRMAEAWEDYEARLALNPAAARLARLLPTLGVEGDRDGPDLRGRTVLLLHEEGFGDTLQFIRYAPLLAARGARVVVAAPRELARLLRGVAGVADVVEQAAGGPLPQHDHVCPCFSLPRAFATNLRTIPAAPYLRADPALVARWGEAVPWRDSPRLRVGLVWAGQARPWLPGFASLDARRSAGAEVFAPLAELDAELVSLQMGGQVPPGLLLQDVMTDVTDFADTAALIAHLDVVVSVDTAVVHLAGAMGKKVLLLDRFDSCWRWLSGRADSPWYPSLHIFRQERPGAWDRPVRRIVAALEAMAAGRREAA